MKKSLDSYLGLFFMTNSLPFSSFIFYRLVYFTFNLTEKQINTTGKFLNMDWDIICDAFRSYLIFGILLPDCILYVSTLQPIPYKRTLSRNL